MLEAVGFASLALIIVALIVSVLPRGRGSRRGYAVVLGILSIMFLTLCSFMLYCRGEVLSLGIFPYFPLKLGCDYLSMLVVLNISIVGVLALLSSYEYLEIYEEGYVPYYFFTLVFIYSMIALALVRDWFWFLYFFEIMTFSSYFLVGYEYRDEGVRRTAWNYFVTMHILCSIPLIVGVALIYVGSSGNLSFAAPVAKFVPVIAALYLVGLSTKSGVFPLHFWLPEAHPVAPSPISALLSGCMVEIGVYGYYRLIAQLGGLPSIVLTAMMVMAFLSTLVGVASYARQRDLKRLFAWSTIDNAGWMYLVLGVMGVHASTLLGLYILLHGLVKAAAFIASGGVLYVFNTKDLEELRGSYSADRLTVGSLVSAMFMLEAVPPSGLFWVRLMALTAYLRFNYLVSVAYAILWCFAFIVFLRNVHIMISGECVRAPLRPSPKLVVGSVTVLLCLAVIAIFMLPGWENVLVGSYG